MPTRHISRLVIPLIAVAFLGCKSDDHSDGASAKMSKQKQSYAAMGRIDRKDPRLDKLLAADVKIERLGEGFDWSEGPVWVSKGDYLLFSDVPRNIVYKWEEGKPLTKHVNPSGYTGSVPRAGEPGSNGLTLDHQGRLILCQHGDRRVARLEKDGTFTALADKFEGKRFNSPNDVAIKSNGDVYFTDPPYGLPRNMNDPTKEIPFQGVYRIGKDGKVTLLTKELTRPNGLAFSPDEKTLYVAVSDPDQAKFWSFPVKEDGTLGEGKVFFDATALAKSGKKGLPDGIKTDREGNLWGTGPGGVLIFAPDGTHLGTIETDEATANCNWGEDGSVLYITADMYVCRVRTKTKGKLAGTK